MDLITRQFVKDLHGYNKVYPFTTISEIFKWKTLEDSNKKKLFEFLSNVFIMGYYGEFGNDSISQLPELNIEYSKTENYNDLIELAQKSNYSGQGAKQHDIVEEFFMANDPFTIAYEIPVWNEKMNGHIDLIRIKGERIEILDFKPNAHKEKKAASQLYRYKQTLSERTGISMFFIDCVYFDNSSAYLLNL